MEPSTYTTLRRSRVRTLRLATMLAGVLTAPLALVATTAAPAIADPESATTTTTTTFAFTGGVQSWTAPAGMTRAEVTLFGAAGEAGGGAHGPYYPGGKGAAVTAVIAVTPGHSYDVYVGGTGADGRGGFNGGGSARHYGGTNSVAGSGGGASDLRLGGGTLDDRLLVAGGGGGGGGGTGPNYGSTGGSVGGSGGDSGTGSPATPGGDDPHSSALGGQPGAAGAEGGAGGTGGTGRFSGERGGTGENGSFGLGGSPTFYPSTGGLGVGGAGGGGYVGGGAGGGGATSWDIGGGAGGGGGGGGSNYVTPLALTSSVTDGVRAGQGEVTISAFSTATAPTGVTATAGNGEATVSFSPPVSDGNSAITGYTVTAVDATNAGRGGQTATGTGGPITLTGLTNGDSYTFTVTATNAAGPGDPGTSNAVTPSAPVTVNKADITVGVSGPTSAKKGAAVSYQVTISNNGPAVARSLTTVFAGTGFIGLHANPTTGSGTMTVAGTRITGLRWTMAELASGATVTYTVSGTLTTSIGRSSSVIAAALSNVPDPSMLNNLATARTGSTK